MRIIEKRFSFGRPDCQSKDINEKLNKIIEEIKAMELRQVRMETRLCRLCEKMNVKLEGAKRCR